MIVKKNNSNIKDNDVHNTEGKKDGHSSKQNTMKQKNLNTKNNK